MPVLVSGKLDQEGVSHARETLLVKAHTKSKAAPGVKKLIQCLGQFRSQLASEERNMESQKGLGDSGGWKALAQVPTEVGWGDPLGPPCWDRDMALGVSHSCGEQLGTARAAQLERNL